MYGWGKAVGVFEVKVAEVVLLVCLGKERCKIKSLTHWAELMRVVIWNWKNVSQKVKQVGDLKLDSSKGKNKILKGEYMSRRKVSQFSCVYRVQVKKGCMIMLGRVSKRHKESLLLGDGKPL